MLVRSRWRINIVLRTVPGLPVKDSVFALNQNLIEQLRMLSFLLVLFYALVLIIPVCNITKKGVELLYAVTGTRGPFVARGLIFDMDSPEGVPDNFGYPKSDAGFEDAWNEGFTSPHAVAVEEQGGRIYETELDEPYRYQKKHL